MRRQTDALTPMATKLPTRLRFTGRVETVWTALWNHPLAEVRAVAEAASRLGASKGTRTRPAPPALPKNRDGAREAAE